MSKSAPGKQKHQDEDNSFGNISLYTIHNAIFMDIIYVQVSLLVLISFVAQNEGAKLELAAEAGIACIDCNTSCAGDCGFCPGT